MSVSQYWLLLTLVTMALALPPMSEVGGVKNVELANDVPPSPPLPNPTTAGAAHDVSRSVGGLNSWWCVCIIYYGRYWCFCWGTELAATSTTSVAARMSMLKSATADMTTMRSDMSTSMNNLMLMRAANTTERLVNTDSSTCSSLSSMVSRWVLASMTSGMPRMVSPPSSMMPPSDLMNDEAAAMQAALNDMDVVSKQMNDELRSLSSSTPSSSTTESLSMMMGDWMTMQYTLGHSADSNSKDWVMYDYYMHSMRGSNERLRDLSGLYPATSVPAATADKAAVNTNGNGYNTWWCVCIIYYGRYWCFCWGTELAATSTTSVAARMSMLKSATADMTTMRSDMSSSMNNLMLMRAANTTERLVNTDSNTCSSLSSMVSRWVLASMTSGMPRMVSPPSSMMPPSDLMNDEAAAMQAALNDMDVVSKQMNDELRSLSSSTPSSSTTESLSMMMGNWMTMSSAWMVKKADMPVEQAATTQEPSPTGYSVTENRAV